jgi:hypothetical protein
MEMTISELGSLGEFIASIAVVITLIALVVQVRVNTAALNETRVATTAQIYQARVDSRRRNLEWLIDCEPVLEILEKLNGPDGNGFQLAPDKIPQLTPRERTIFELYSDMGLLSLDNHVYQYQQGVLDEDFYRSYTIPQIRAGAPMWQALGIDHSTRRKAFADEVDRILQQG